MGALCSHLRHNVPTSQVTSAKREGACAVEIEVKMDKSSLQSRQ